MQRASEHEKFSKILYCKENKPVFVKNPMKTKEFLCRSKGIPLPRQKHISLAGASERGCAPFIRSCEFSRSISQVTVINFDGTRKYLVHYRHFMAQQRNSFVPAKEFLCRQICKIEFQKKPLKIVFRNFVPRALFDLYQIPF